MITLAKSKNGDINYLARIVNITHFQPHPNAEKMKIARVGGYEICVGLNEPEGYYIYFPTNSKINPNLLGYCNLYRHSDKNANPTISGFFEDNGRVKAIKLRGVVSDGFLLPFETFNSFLQNNINESIEPFDNVEFDTIENNKKSFWICKKYVVERKFNSIRNNRNQKVVSKYNKIIDTQFRLHYETVTVKKEPWCIQPFDLISVTSKWHGTSAISAYVLCKKDRNFFQRIWDKITHTTPTFYDYVYSSRKVIKNANYNSQLNTGYYNCDVWGEADKVVRPHLIKGMSIYYEIVGFLPNGGFIQDGYDYGCVSPKEGENYTYDKHFKVRVYRITLTNVDGIVHEFSAREVQQWCKDNGLTPVKEFYYGLAGSLYGWEKGDYESWNDMFWAKMADDKSFYMEANSPDCNNIVPHEGVVIKKEDMIPRAWKLKSYAFLGKSQADLDKGIENIEDEN